MQLYQRESPALFDKATDRIQDHGERRRSSEPEAGTSTHLLQQPKLLAKPDSWVAKRAAFATKSIWTVPYAEDELYPAGKWVPQTRITPPDSVSCWAERDENVRNTDIVTYLTVGVTHIPRPEDYPVMPQETCMVMFKPVGLV